jgi:hypothetical protein
MKRLEKERLLPNRLFLLRRKVKTQKKSKKGELKL